MLITDDNDSELELTVPVEDVSSDLPLKCVNRLDLIKLQRTDKSLKTFYDLVVSDDCNVETDNYFVIHNDILIRNCRDQ